MTDLTIIDNKNPAEVFTGGSLELILQKIEAEARAHKADITTEEGRKAIASNAYKVARSKTALDDIGKDLVSGWKAQAAVVDGKRREVRDRLDALKNEVRKPLDDFEAAEDLRLESHKRRIQEIKDCMAFMSTPSLESIAEASRKAAALYQHEWQEFQAIADFEYQIVRTALEIKYKEREKYDAEQAELEILRKQVAEQQQKERDERIAKEAEEKAKKAAADQIAAAEKRALDAEAAQKAMAEKERQDKIAAESKAKISFGANPTIPQYRQFELVEQWARKYNLAVMPSMITDLLQTLNFTKAVAA